MNEGMLSPADVAVLSGANRNNNNDGWGNNGDYCPENCRWVSAQEQSNHKTNNVWYTYKGVTKTGAQWCKTFGIKYMTFLDRLKRGWSLEQALTVSTSGNGRKIK